LERISRSRPEPKQRIERARIILACLGGDPQARIAKRRGTGRIRFRNGGYGLPARVLKVWPTRRDPASRRDEAARPAGTPPPKGQASWDGLTLAKAVGAKKSSVYALLRTMAFNCGGPAAGASTDPQFAAKATGIIGLYVAPPHQALVLSVDENPAFKRCPGAPAMCEPPAARSCAGSKVPLGATVR
jgi:hypothetical protein